jgi:Putative MetA-pathway of phenol degradation
LKRSLFIEYVGNFPSNGRNSQSLNSGGGYRIDDHHQIDFHVGVGLDRNAPNYTFGVGYSFRLDGFLQRGVAAAPPLQAAPRLDLVTK